MCSSQVNITADWTKAGVNAGVSVMGGVVITLKSLPKTDPKNPEVTRTLDNMEAFVVFFSSDEKRELGQDRLWINVGKIELSVGCFCFAGR